MKLRALLLAGLCITGGQAHAGLFSDDEARQQIQQVGKRVSTLEDADKQQAEINRQQDDVNKQQTRSMLDLQSQIEVQNAELRKLRGQNEDLAHSLQDAEKRQKDFYIDLDARLRHFETIEAQTPPPQPEKPADADDPAAENRAYEAAYKLFKAGKHEDAVAAFQGFLEKYPDSVHAPNVHYELASTYFALKDYKNALANYQVVATRYAFSPKAPDAMLSVADCQEELKDTAAAKKTLKQIIAKYPGSEAASEAKKRLAALK